MQSNPYITQQATKHLQDVIHVESDHDNKENIANIVGDLNNGLRDNLSNVLGNNHIEPEPTIPSGIVSKQMMMAVQREMFTTAIQQNTQLGGENSELMRANREYYGEFIQLKPIQMKIFDMTHPEQYCGGVKQLTNIRDTLQANFQLHTQLFQPRDHDKVKCTVSLLTTWNIHSDMPQRQIQITNLMKWLWD